MTGMKESKCIDFERVIQLNGIEPSLFLWLDLLYLRFIKAFCACTTQVGQANLVFLVFWTMHGGPKPLTKRVYEPKFGTRGAVFQLKGKSANKDWGSQKWNDGRCFGGDGWPLFAPKSPTPCCLTPTDFASASFSPRCFNISSLVITAKKFHLLLAMIIVSETTTILFRI